MSDDTEVVKVEDDVDVAVKTSGRTVVLTLDPKDEWGQRESVFLFPEEAKAIRKALKRAIRQAKNN